MTVLIRKAAAILALAALAGLVLTLERGAYGVNPRLVVFTQVLLLPMAVTAVGIGLDRPWARWLGLAGALALLPWALVLTFGLPGGAPLLQQSIALGAAVVLLVSLTGRTMFERFEGRSGLDWSGRRMGLVRWTIILNLASALGLSLFVALYRYSVEWHVAIPGLLLLGLVVGVLLLARQRTVGLLLVGLSCVLFVPGGAYFVWQEATHTGEVYLFAASFLPGVLAGWACLIAFGRPILDALRAG